MASLMKEATALLKKLSTKPKIFGSEAYRGLKKVVDAQKGLGKTISADVRRTITDAMANLTAMAATKEYSDTQQSKAAAEAKVTASKQLEDIMNIMYNQGNDGIGQEGSTTTNKGPSGSKGDE